MSFWSYRSAEEGNLPVLSSGQISNPTEEYMVVLCCIGTIIDYGNDPTT